MDERKSRAERRLSQRLVLAFLLAPPVVPLVLSVLTVVSGLWLSDPKDPGTPIGIVLLPVLLMTVGVLIAYLVAGLAWWPVIWWLRRRGGLHFSSLLTAGFLLSWGLTGLLALGIQATTTPRPPVTELLWSTLKIAAAFLPATLAAVLVFWWLVRDPLPDDD